jgi:hypothetical protein
MQIKTFLIAITFFATFSVAGFGQNENRRIKMESAPVSVDSTEYELIVIDPGFDSWYITRQIEQHSHEYYKLKNIQYVTEWNNRLRTSGKYSDLFNSTIDYDPSVNYPFELDSKLYWYFVYFEETNNMKLLPYSR